MMHDSRDSSQPEEFPPDVSNATSGNYHPNNWLAAQAAVRTPSILLILIGVFSLMTQILAIAQLPQVPATADENIRQIQQNPNMDQQQKEFWIDLFRIVKEQSQNPITYAIQIVVAVLSVVVIIGGLQMRNLSGMGLPVTASILSMIPCVSGCCCLLGVPVGIWSLIVLSRPEVKAAIYRR